MLSLLPISGPIKDPVKSDLPGDVSISDTGDIIEAEPNTDLK
jgi:hypothetical protein